MNDRESSPRSGEQRRRALLRWSITVAIGAVLIIAVGTLGPILLGQRGSQTTSTSVAAHERSEQLRSQAESASAAGDVQAARALAQSAVEADPANAAARDLVTRLSAGGGSSVVTPTPTPTPGGGSSQPTSAPTTPSQSPDAGYTQPVADLAGLLPTAFSGWSFDQSLVSKEEVSVSASPASADAAAGKLIWTVRDRETIAGAKSFISKTTKVLYGKKAATVTVHGVPAYYGTDGGRLATVTYTRGRYVFELIFPSALGRTKGVSAAAAFRDTPVR